MTGFDDCLAKGLIRPQPGAEARSTGSLETARRFLRSARRTEEIQESEMTVIAAYNAIFHAARALLFRKGYIEKSHYCLFRALAELYEDERLLREVSKADKIRMSRHQLQYDGAEADEEEASHVLDTAQKFLDHAERVLGPVDARQAP